MGLRGRQVAPTLVLEVHLTLELLLLLPLFFLLQCQLRLQLANLVLEVFDLRELVIELLFALVEYVVSVLLDLIHADVLETLEAADLIPLLLQLLSLLVYLHLVGTLHVGYLGGLLLLQLLPELDAQLLLLPLHLLLHPGLDAGLHLIVTVLLLHLLLEGSDQFIQLFVELSSQPVFYLLLALFHLLMQRLLLLLHLLILGVVVVDHACFDLRQHLLQLQSGLLLDLLPDLGELGVILQFYLLLDILRDFLLQVRQDLLDDVVDLLRVVVAGTEATDLFFHLIHSYVYLYHSSSLD